MICCSSHVFQVPKGGLLLVQWLDQLPRWLLLLEYLSFWYGSQESVTATTQMVRVVFKMPTLAHNRNHVVSSNQEQFVFIVASFKRKASLKIWKQF